MGIDIGGAFTIAGASGSQALKIAGAVDALTIDTTGRTYYPNQIGFIAGLNTDPGWVAQPSGAWVVQNYWNNTVYNKGGGWANPRFTAPVAGSYLFHWIASQYKPSAVAGNYMHSSFWVNGGHVYSGHLLKGYYEPAGGYWVTHSEIVNIIYMNAGDYIEVQLYHSAAGFSLYRYYSEFSGFLVG